MVGRCCSKCPRVRHRAAGADIGVHPAVPMTQPAWPSQAVERLVGPGGHTSHEHEHKHMSRRPCAPKLPPPRHRLSVAATGEGMNESRVSATLCLLSRAEQRCQSAATNPFAHHRATLPLHPIYPLRDVGMLSRRCSFIGSRAVAAFVTSRSAQRRRPFARRPYR
ncbi:hypothetical protein CC85DRAFT_167813 [Cutaneotrichosporon oleaginosum]|uniref:Uncharacterized protein n=1 Tax=Cutaneotrichosporon oleaginosum TaxID=879819 RepID=A0A0J0XFU3_9TREE|nr:uncharacterized protein CC85DRAFT_167813 [Cutaneotrichosporon oleaginosum]KLT39940.1 hypothetical protein CC85DRAFT_167813 [Cutaneotrichosporon oleaginosum]TXT08354.1 hypothetical protein COLE_05278 [Cutaneotrichosporon oleaginosum]